MNTINSEIKVNSILSKQNSPINVLSQEKFSSFLDNEEMDGETIVEETIPKVDILMQSLQNKAQLNRMVIEAVA